MTDVAVCDHNNSINNIIRGKMSLKDDLVNDSRKENYKIIDNHEITKKKETSERKVLSQHVKNGEDNDITSVENSAPVVPKVEIMDINILSLTKLFSV